MKVFDLETSVIEWNILPDEHGDGLRLSTARCRGRRIRVDRGRPRPHQRHATTCPESTTVHWHGLILPNAMDGAAEITQEPIAPGETFTYEFMTEQRGTYFYHSHDHIDRQQALGLYGALIIDPREPADDHLWHDQELVVQLQELLEREGYSWPAMPMEGGLPNYFTINGKAYPETETVRMRVGETLLVRFIGTNSGVHPPDAHPRRAVPHRRDRRQSGAGGGAVGRRTPSTSVPASATTCSGRRGSPGNGCCTATSPTTRPTTMSRPRAAAG